MAREPRKLPTDDPELRWLEAPAVYCDTYSVDAYAEPRIVRLVFGDHVGERYVPYYRAAIVMPMEDARELANSLLRVIKTAEEEIIETEKAKKVENESG